MPERTPDPLLPWRNTTPLTKDEMKLIGELNRQRGVRLTVSQRGQHFYLRHAQIRNAISVSIRLTVDASHNGDGLPNPSLLLTGVLLRVRLITLGETNLNTVRAIGDLASALLDGGDLSDARHLSERVVDTLRRKLGESNPDTVGAMQTLALILQRQGNLVAARELQEQVLKWCRETKGEESHYTFTAMSNLANTMMSQDNSAARKFHGQALEGYRRVFGDRHALTIRAMLNLSLCMSKDGDFEAARELQEIVVRERQAGVGHGIPDLNRAKRALAVTMEMLGESKAAEETLRSAFEECSVFRGDAHPETLLSAYFLAQYLYNSGAVGESLAIARVGLNGMLVAARRGLDINCLLATANLAGLLVHVQVWKTKNIKRCFPEFTRGPSWMRNLVNRLTHMFREEDGEWLEKRLGLSRRIPRAKDDWHAFWRVPFVEISEIWVRDLELALGQIEGIRKDFIRYHVAWLQLCVADAPSDIPQVLSALQGREMAAAALADLTGREGAYDPEDVRTRLLEARRKLSAIFFRMSILDGGGSGSGFGEDRKRMAMPIDSVRPPADPEVQKSRREGLQKQHAELLAQYRDLETEVAELDPQFRVALRARTIDAGQMASRLDGKELAVLLFTLPGEKGSGVPRYFACCVSAVATQDLAQGPATEPVRVIELPGLSKVVSQSITYNKQYRGAAARSGTVRGIPSEAGLIEHDKASDTPPEPKITSAEIEGAIQVGLWEPLRTAFPQVRQWHVIPHQSLHAVPLLASVREGVDACTFPGMVFFIHNRETLPPSPLGLLPVALHIDPAWDSHPIPFVEAEAALVAALIPGMAVFRGIDALDHLTRADLLTFGSAAHGDFDETGDRRQAEITIDNDKGVRIDAVTMLGLPARPTLAVFSNCLAGRIHEEIGGDPIGLVTVQMMRGARQVVASLAPLSDFFTPILMGLFWHAYLAKAEARDALTIAKVRLRSGEWPEGFDALVRDAYRPVMFEVLKRCANHADHAHESESEAKACVRLVRSIAGWTLPEVVWANYFSDPLPGIEMEFVMTYCRDEQSRTGLVDKVMRELVDVRDWRDSDEVQHMNLWVQAFGMA